MYLAVFNEALYMPDHLDGILMTPNQVRAHGVIVDDVLKSLSPRFESKHAIIFPEFEGEDPEIPLQLNGFISYFEVFKPTFDHLHSLPVLEFTRDTEWDPYLDDSYKEEMKMEFDPGRSPFGSTASRTIRSIHSEEAEFDSIDDTGFLKAVMAMVDMSLSWFGLA